MVTSCGRRVQLRDWEKTTDHGGVGAQTAELKNNDPVLSSLIGNLPVLFCYTFTPYSLLCLI